MEKCEPGSDRTYPYRNLVEPQGVLPPRALSYLARDHLFLWLLFLGTCVLGARLRLMGQQTLENSLLLSYA
jgi:hypothetical protein